MSSDALFRKELEAIEKATAALAELCPKVGDGLK